MGAQWAAWHPYTIDLLVNLITMTLGSPAAGDRRCEPRLPVDFDGSLLPGDRESQLVKIHSLSTRGAFVAMESPLEVGAEFTLSFRLGNEAIELHGEVTDSIGRPSKWQQRYARGIGVRDRKSVV